jgi:hypothetical protein
VSALSLGDGIAVRFPNSAATAIKVVSVASEQMVIQTTDGTKWRLVPATKAMAGHSSVHCEAVILVLQIRNEAENTCAASRAAIGLRAIAS